MEEAIANQNQANKEKEDGFKVKKRTLDLLPDAENNIAKLQVSLLLSVLLKMLKKTYLSNA